MTWITYPDGLEDFETKPSLLPLASRTSIPPVVLNLYYDTKEP